MKVEWRGVVIGFALALAGCAKEAVPVAESASAPVKVPLTIYADNYPVMYFAERIVGPLAKVILPVAADRDPAYFKPSRAVIADIQSADLVLLNGAEYSKWPVLVSLAPTKTIDTSRGFKGRYLTIEDAIVHSHGPEGEHSHAGLASYTWLDPDQAVLQAEAIAKGLKGRLPGKEKEIDERLTSLVQDLRALRATLQEMVKEKNEPLLASHPVYDYLARHCGWNLKSLHWEPDEMPSEEGWKELSQLLEKHPARWIIWEGSPKAEIAQRLAGLGINSVVFDCCVNRPAEGDYLSVMRQNVLELGRVYQFDPDGATR